MAIFIKENHLIGDSLQLQRFSIIVMAGSTEACRWADTVLERLAENSTPGSAGSSAVE